VTVGLRARSDRELKLWEGLRELSEKGSKIVPLGAPLSAGSDGTRSTEAPPFLRKGWATPVCSRRSPTDVEFYSTVTTVNVIIQACAVKKKPSERVGHPPFPPPAWLSDIIDYFSKKPSTPAPPIKRE
jgi:hypothetical protein